MSNTHIGQGPPARKSESAIYAVVSYAVSRRAGASTWSSEPWRSTTCPNHIRPLLRSIFVAGRNRGRTPLSSSTANQTDSGKVGVDSQPIATPDCESTIGRQIIPYVTRATVFLYNLWNYAKIRAVSGDERRWMSFSVQTLNGKTCWIVQISADESEDWLLNWLQHVREHLPCEFSFYRCGGN